MFYLKASLIISAVSALPLSQFNARQAGGLVQPELIPGACSWQCNPIISIGDTCQGNVSCPCTAIATKQLQNCLDCYWTQNSQVPGDGSWMTAATEWANNFNLQCREAGVNVPAVVAGGNDLNAVNPASDASSEGSPAVPRVGSPPGSNPLSSAPAAPAPPTTPPPVPTPTPSPAPSTPSSSSSSATSQTPIFTPPPTPSSTQTPSPSVPGLGSSINLGSQTIILSGSSAPIIIPVNNASSNASSAADAAEQDNAARRPMADVWIALIAGTVSVMAAVMF